LSRRLIIRRVIIFIIIATTKETPANRTSTKACGDATSPISPTWLLATKTKKATGVTASHNPTSDTATASAGAAASAATTTTSASAT
jgi:hypothetical protein